MSHWGTGRLTMGVVGTVAFGVDFHTQDVDESEISEAAKELIASAQALFTQNREHLLSTHIFLVYILYIYYSTVSINYSTVTNTGVLQRLEGTCTQCLCCCFPLRCPS